MSQVMDHLIESEGDPKSSSAHIVEASEVTRPRLDPVHGEVRDEIHHGQPPVSGVHVKSAAEGEKFLAENKTKEGVKTTASGLQYKVIKEGTGAQPKANDTVSVNYRGTLIDGTEFDSSYKRGQPATFPVSGVIKGWTEALQLMKSGSKYQLFIPASLAYGDRGAGRDIAPNSTLIFEVELLDVKPPAGGASSSGSPSASPK